MTVAAGICSLILVLGFGLPCIGGIRHLARTGEVWTFMGFPAYGGGPFERWGLGTGGTSVALMVGFVLVCAAEVVAGVMILAGAPGAAVLAWALLPFEFFFWIGFALPFGPPLGLARAVLVLLA